MCHAQYFTLNNYTDQRRFHVVPPSPPRNVRVVNKTEDSITVAWDPPKWPRTGNLTYGIYIATNGGDRIKTSTHATIERIIEITSKE